MKKLEREVNEELFKDNFMLDLSIFEKLSREVGYLNHKANIKTYDKKGNEQYDNKSIKEYEKLRAKQSIMQQELIKHYSPEQYKKFHK